MSKILSRERFWDAISGATTPTPAIEHDSAQRAKIERMRELLQAAVSYYGSWDYRDIATFERDVKRELSGENDT